MSRSLLTLLVLLMGVSAPAFSHTAKKAATEAPEKVEEAPGSQFQIEPHLLQSMYDSESKAVQAETREKTANVEMGIQASLLNASLFELSTKYFTTKYQEGTPRIPMAFITATTSLMRPVHWLEVQAQGKVGYSDLEGVFPVRSEAGLELTDVVKLHWLPLGGGLRLRFLEPATTFVQPALAAGVGAQFLNQEGQLDGMNQNFWVPFYYITPSLTFFNEVNKGSWFGGITLGATVNENFASSNQIKLWSIDLSASLLL